MLEWKEITLSYGNRKVLNKFSLTVNEGDKVILYGKSGGGKSTVLKLALGFTTPDKGAVYFGGKLIDEKTVWQARKKIAYVSQDTDIGEGKVSELITEVSSFKAVQKIPDVHPFLRQFSLTSDFLEKDIGELSGGEKQRLAIVISLMLGRKIFFLDEITSALDKRLKARIARYFMENSCFTVVAISHDESWLGHGYKEVRV
jgi:putative ABC transport system ATP-binding protein